jgi:acyl transferase domain-containing protein/phosphopantetheinyl transferase
MNPAGGERWSHSAALQGEVAIIGMAGLFPGAPDLDTYWQNIVSKTDAVTDPPTEAWDPKVFYDPSSNANDRVYCKRGGYIGDLAQFQPLDFGIMPATVDGGEPDQWLALRVARAALADAGYLESPKEHDRTEVILGKGTYINRGNMTVGYHGLIVEQVLQVLRNLHPEYTDSDLATIKQELKAGLPPFSADTAPALIGNIIAGRIANRLDLMGPAFTVDAACASALLAVETGMRDLLSHKCDLALVGGVNVNTPLPTVILFCQLGALSRREQIRPFDKDADGTILGEGLGMVVLKRLTDAERDRDRIYAVIKGVGTASDGRALHVMAPRVEGEEMALRLAYDMAGVPPRSVGLIEAHGTATPVGDAVEIQALTRVFGERHGSLPSCAVGSVKSMIGHTMPAAGIAGLIKTALALYHRVLPPTLHCDEPHPALGLEKTPFYINSGTRPWIHGAHIPRRAGVNAFGFGGINGHVVLEEYPDNEREGRSHLLHWETEVCVLEGTSRQDLVEKGERLQGYLKRAGQISLKDLAYTLNNQLQDKAYRLAIIASSVEDLGQKLAHAERRLADPRCRQIKDNRGIYFFEEPLSRQGKLAFMFPGEGAQYENMLLDLCLHFPEVRICFDLADRAFIDHSRNYLPSDYIFPRSVVSEPEQRLVEKLLWQIDGAVEAVLIANGAMWSLLSRLEIRPDAILGHSTGDYSAMFASGVIALDDIKTILAWNSTHERLAIQYPVLEAALVAVAADSATVKSIVEQVGGDIYVAMENCPHQSVIVGHRTAVEQAVEHLRQRGLIYEFLPFDRPYHTPMFEPYAEGAGREFFSQLALSAPNIDVYSCTTASRYPTSLAEFQELFVAHWVRPVLFQETIERMYADGVRIFVEVGPRGNLTAFVDDILRGSPHLAMPANVARRSGITQLNHLVGALAAHGIAMNLQHLYARRDPQGLPWEATEAEDTARRSTPPRKLFLGMPHLRVAPRHQEAAAHKPQLMASSAPLAVPEHQARQPSIAATTPKPLPSRASDHAAANATLVMQEYMKGMESFLELQHLVMQAFFNRQCAQGQDNGNAAMAPSTHDFPLLGTVISQVPNQELVALRRLDQDEDLFLREHALGGPLSLTDPTLKPVMVVPLTMSMEMLAQAGAALMPGKILIGMRDIQAHHWIRVDEPVTLRILARRISSTSHEVEVQVQNRGRETADNEEISVMPVIRGIMIFGDTFPASPPIAPFSVAAERKSRLASANLYDGRLMFHGPCFQGVAAVERSGQDGLIGKLQVLSPEGLFWSTSSPRFITDPVVLDAAGQLVGFWAAEYLERGFVVFPYYLKSLNLYGPNELVGERVTCRLKLQLLGTDRIRSDLDVFRSDGKLWMQLSGWEDRRFDLPQRFHRFWVSPRETLMSLPWQSPLEPLPGNDRLECCRLESFFEDGDMLWQDLWASLVLTRRERGAFQSLKGPAIRLQEWLSGRTAAKDAVRMFLKKHYRLDLFPADIEIAQDEYGRPILGGSWAQGLPAVPKLSLTHSNGMAVAIVGDESSGSYLGIDLEVIRQLPSSFESVAFTGDEQRLLAAIPESAQTEWILRLWCAKEAIAKALGRGFLDGPHSVRIQAFDLRTGIVTVSLQGKLVAAFTDFVGTDLLAYTAREGDYVIASTLCERKAS